MPEDYKSTSIHVCGRKPVERIHCSPVRTRKILITKVPTDEEKKKFVENGAHLVEQKSKKKETDHEQGELESQIHENGATSTKKRRKGGEIRQSTKPTDRSREKVREMCKGLLFNKKAGRRFLPGDNDGLQAWGNRQLCPCERRVN